VTASQGPSLRSQIVTASQSKRNTKVTPYAFTEQGVAMLSGILNSEKAINMNIAIMRAFVVADTLNQRAKANTLRISLNFDALDKFIQRKTY
jgi:hypothetical protein